MVKKEKLTRLTAQQIEDVFGNSDIKRMEGDLDGMRKKLNWLREHKLDPKYVDRIDEIEHLEIKLEAEIKNAGGEIRGEINRYSETNRRSSS